MSHRWLLRATLQESHLPQSRQGHCERCHRTCPALSANNSALRMRRQRRRDGVRLVAVEVPEGLLGKRSPAGC